MLRLECILLKIKEIQKMPSQNIDLAQLAAKVLLDRGLQPEIFPAALHQLEAIQAPAPSSPSAQDLRHLLWCSIDNDDSRDLDQLTYAEKNSTEKINLYVAIADVDALVQKNTPLDQYAQTNTTSVYTPAKIFPMLPEKLSTNLTSLNEEEDRLAMVVKLTVSQSGDIFDASIFSAMVKNQAKLAYHAVGSWLEGKGPIPEKIQKNKSLEETIRLQNHMAQIIKKKRLSFGALSLQTSESFPVIRDGKIIGMSLAIPNPANELIENFMIAANGAIANFLTASKTPSLRRVVQIPKRWDRIIELAKQKGENLPQEPNGKALEQFLIKMKAKDPLSFPDLSLMGNKITWKWRICGRNAWSSANRSFWPCFAGICPFNSAQSSIS